MRMIAPCQEGDLIIAEVHEVYKDGTLQLHMPGTRTGKLGGGCLIRIAPSLVKRQKIHRHRLAVPRVAGGDSHEHAATEVIHIGLILGCNGYVWVGPSRAMDIGLGLAAPTGVDHNANGAETWRECVAERLAVSRVRNCILALARNGMPVWETSVLAACEASLFVDHDQDGDDEEADADGFDDVRMKENQAAAVSTARSRITRLLRPDVARRIVLLTQTKMGSAT